MKIISTIILAITIPCLLLSSCNSDQEPEITSDDNYIPAQIKLVHGTLFVVRAVLNDSMDLDMLIDTGSSRTYVPAGTFGNREGEVILSSLCLENGICFKNIIAISTESAFTQNKTGYFNGIIGVDLLMNFDVTFDYKNQLIYFYDTLENVSSGPMIIPFQYISSRPFTNVSIEKLPQGVNLLDTGAAYTRIDDSMLASLTQEPDVLFESISFTLDGYEMTEYAALTGYCVGPACPTEIIIQVGSWAAVGGTFFREYLTIFKFSENLLKLNPYDDRSHIKESGIQRLGLQINIYDASEIVYVKENGAAWKGGLMEGDEIISVNNFPIGSLGYFGVYELMEDTSIKEYQFLIRTPEGNVEEVIVQID